ncbi:predicted protein [Uncinocarpus reesii 1704]|uniref:Uncharacterized protein n=1 Tax=Uncinocarpus reesii (strain UAMH 1704) TaxID=336963 RepID=C4JDD6_UNCRE|nr:uncharacterized protein UREG_00302 [Uncinocarpus reesii 1704]EEP75456.1 predicted protein [Uncinocarpus reesii 1704]
MRKLFGPQTKDRLRFEFAALPTPPPTDLDVPEEDVQFKSQRRRPRRRATLPSLVLSTEEGRELASRIAQEGSRDGDVSSSLMDRKSIVERPLQTTTAQLKRRSRSAYALRESARAHRMSPIQWRRRSDEMKLWRASFGKKVEPDPVLDRPESPITTAEEENDPTEIRVESLAPNGELGQFDFGNLMSNMQEDNDVNLTQRVSTLEVKLMDLEFAIAKMQGSNISPITPSPIPPPKPMNSAQNADSEHLTPQLPHPLRSSPYQDTAPPRTSPTTTDRPISTATLRPHTAAAHSSPPISPYPFTSPGISVEQYSALTTLVRREQSARKHLEKQVLQLQQEVQQLRASSRSGQDSFLRASSPDSRSTASSQRGKHDRMDSGMWRQTSESSYGRSSNASPESYAMKSESSSHRMNPFDKIMGRG